MRVVACVLLMSVLLAAQQPPHSTHNPKHGGLFFSVAGDTLHIEGLWPEQRVFTLFVYDEASRPLPIERMRQIEGVVEAKGMTARLVLRDDGSAFETRVPSMTTLPVTITLQIRFQKDGEPEGIGFLFAGYSTEPADSFDLTPTVIPGTLDGLLTAITDDVKEAESLAVRGQSAFMFSPALHGRDHLLALEPYVPPLDDARRAPVESAIRTAVRLAWLLHSAGDDGSDAQARAAVILFGKAMAGVVDAFRGVKR